MKVARISLHAAFCLLLLLGLTGTVSAAGKSAKSTSSNTSSSSDSSSSSQATSATGVQTYTSSTPLQVGTIVQLASGKTANSVAPSTFAKMQDMYGVVIDPNALPITVSSNLTNQTYVADGGRYDVLVSTQGGPIKEGDYVTISNVDGVAMEAGTYDQQHMVFGRAAANFDGKSGVIYTTTLKTTTGNTIQTVQVGLIPVAINIQRNPNQKSTKVDLPPFLQQLGQAVAQKPIGPAKIYMSLIITGACIIVALVTLYAGIRNAVIAIGRNPLSKKSIFRGLLEIIVTSFLILIIGLFAVYLLLKL